MTHEETESARAVEAIRALNVYPALSDVWPIRVGDVYIDVYAPVRCADGAYRYSGVQIDSILVTRVSPPREAAHTESSWEVNCIADCLVRRATTTCNEFINDMLLYKSTAWRLLHRCP